MLFSKGTFWETTFYKQETQHKHKLKVKHEALDMVASEEEVQQKWEIEYLNERKQVVTYRWLAYVF